LFEATKINGQALAISITKLLDKYGLRKKIIVYGLTKRWGVKFNAMTIVLYVVVNCESFGLKESFQGTCFGHVFSKACQYDTTKENVCKDLKYVFIKSI